MEKTLKEQFSALKEQDSKLKEQAISEHQAKYAQQQNAGFEKLLERLNQPAKLADVEKGFYEETLRLYDHCGSSGETPYSFKAKKEFFESLSGFKKLKEFCQIQDAMMEVCYRDVDLSTDHERATHAEINIVPDQSYKESGYCLWSKDKRGLISLKKYKYSSHPVSQKSRNFIQRLLGKR